ncbi:MAG: polyphosphate kinase 1 [Bacilli bacterium]|jgi:polyphosphate kinase|nr:polyphosphate kinase 1 [Bacilli bacterium]
MKKKISTIPERAVETKEKEDNPFLKGIYCNREYSWLQFDRRVLDQADDLRNPLLERLKFFAIFHSNLDEFFMVRIGSLTNDGRLNPDARENKTDLTAQEQIHGLLKRIKKLYGESDQVFHRLTEELEANGISLIKPDDLKKDRLQEAHAIFTDDILPLLSPMVLDAKHPLVRFDNNHIYMMMELEKGSRSMMGILGIPDTVNRLYPLSGKKKTILITAEDLIKAFGDDAFPGYHVKEKALLRVTRNADFDINIDDAELERNFDFQAYMKSKVESRFTMDPVRVEIDKDSPSIRSFVLKTLGLKKAQCFKTKYYLDYKFLYKVGSYLPDEKALSLKYPPFKGRVEKDLVPPANLIDVIRKKDVFLFYPYDSMDTVINLLDQAASDKRVVSIKMTIYRLDSHSKIVEALKKASENGKDVTVVIELCARFDEENNLYFAEELKEAGCSIIYGMENFKVHSKIFQILLNDNGQISYITHLGTGNYNESTAKLYTDLNILTADKQIGEDGNAFFRNIAICNIAYHYKKLLIAPQGLKKGLLSLLDEQIALAKAHQPAVFKAKFNSLTDKEMIDKIYQAYQAGVKVDLLVRGICCLRPGLPGKTDNLHVTSIVGRFLEHSRIYCFGQGDQEKVYIASADLMTRNTDKRVEIATPVFDKEIASRISKILDVLLSDNVKARIILPDGTYQAKDVIGESINAQEKFLELKY